MSTELKLNLRTVSGYPEGEKCQICHSTNGQDRVFSHAISSREEVHFSCVECVHRHYFENRDNLCASCRQPVDIEGLKKSFTALPLSWSLTLLRGRVRHFFENQENRFSVVNFGPYLRSFFTTAIGLGVGLSHLQSPYPIPLSLCGSLAVISALAQTDVRDYVTRLDPVKITFFTALAANAIAHLFFEKASLEGIGYLVCSVVSMMGIFHGDTNSRNITRVALAIGQALSGVEENTSICVEVDIPGFPRTPKKTKFVEIEGNRSAWITLPSLALPIKSRELYFRSVLSGVTASLISGALNGFSNLGSLYYHGVFVTASYLASAFFIGTERALFSNGFEKISRRLAEHG